MKSDAKKRKNKKRHFNNTGDPVNYELSEECEEDCTVQYIWIMKY